MSVVAAREDRPLAAIAIMAVTVLLFTLIDTSAKWLILAGMPALHVVISRYIGAFIVNLLVFVGREGWGVFRSNRPGIQLLRAITLLSSTVLNFLALSYLPITLTIAFFFAIPVVTTLLSIPILGERVGMRRMVAVLVGFCGVLVIVQPWGAGFHWAVIYSICAMLTASLYFVLTRLLAGVDQNSTCQLWSTGLATLCLLPLAVKGIAWPEDTVGLAVFLLIGVLGAVSHVLVTLAYRFAPAQTVAPVSYVQAVYAAAVGYLVFETLPTVWTALGTAIIIGSGAYIWWRERTRLET